MFAKTIIGAVFLAVASFGTLPANAADYVVDDDDAIVATEEQDDTRVYGWASERPLDCGAYHYWDGEACADARVTPPDTGPKD